MCNPVTTLNPEVLLDKGVHLGFEWEVTCNRMGYRCGYVRIPPDHPWHGLGYEEVETADGGYVDVHGGLTFAQPDTDCGKGGEDNAWWLGFDCAHYMDAPDSALPGYNPILEHGGTIKNTSYVAAECRKLAEQAHEADKC
jgi:hypothetical protein